MHASLFVIGPDTERQLAPFNEQLEVEPYRQPISSACIQRMREYYASGDSKRHPVIPIDAPISAYQPVVSDWDNWEGLDVDANGYYRISTNNQRGKWDWYQVGGRWDGRIIMFDGAKVNWSASQCIDWQAMNRLDEEGYSYWPFAILADGVFQERREWVWDAENEEGKSVEHFSEEDWRDHCYQFLSRLAPDTLVTLIDYHH